MRTTLFDKPEEICGRSGKELDIGGSRGGGPSLTLSLAVNTGTRCEEMMLATCHNKYFIFGDHTSHQVW
jgi:hypothetical protein